MKKVTAAALRKAGACSMGVAMFEEAFPNGVVPNQALARAVALTLSASYVSLLLDTRRSAAYYKACDRSNDEQSEHNGRHEKNFGRDVAELNDRLKRRPMSHERYAEKYSALARNYRDRLRSEKHAHEIRCAVAAVRLWQKQNGEKVK